MYKFGLAISLLAYSTSTIAQQWIKLGEGATGFVDYYDTSSLRRTGDEVAVWVMSDYANDKTVPWAKAKRLYVIKCKASTAAVAAYISYDSDGVVMENETIDPSDIKQVSMSPGSAGGAMIDATCSDRADGATKPAQAGSTPKAARSASTRSPSSDTMRAPSGTINLDCDRSGLGENFSERFLSSFEPSGGNADVQYDLGVGGKGQSVGQVRITPSIATVNFVARFQTINLTYILHINRKTLEFSGTQIGAALGGGLPITGTCKLVKKTNIQNRF